MLIRVNGQTVIAVSLSVSLFGVGRSAAGPLLGEVQAGLPGQAELAQRGAGGPEVAGSEDRGNEEQAAQLGLVDERVRASRPLHSSPRAGCSNAGSAGLRAGWGSGQGDTRGSLPGGLSGWRTGSQNSAGPSFATVSGWAR